MTKAEELGDHGFLMGFSIEMLTHLVNKMSAKGRVWYIGESFVFSLLQSEWYARDRGCCNLVSRIKTNNGRVAAKEQ